MIEIHDHGAVRELRLARPPVNALSPDLLTALVDALESAPEAGASVIVLSGSTGIFTAGLDIPTLLALDRNDMEQALDVFFGAMEALATSSIPVVAAITGHSPAGGCVLALFCDWRVMAEGSYVIGLNEVRVGIPMPGLIATAAARLVGPGRAEQICTGGQLLSPDEALRIGLVDRVVPPDEVVSEAIGWGREIATLPPRAVALTRETVRADLVTAVRSARRDDSKRMLDEWFRPETQRPLHELVDKLKKR